MLEAIQNPSAPHSPDESLAEMFAYWADRFTVWHLRMLAFFDDPKGWFAARSSTPAAVAGAGDSGLPGIV